MEKIPDQSDEPDIPDVNPYRARPGIAYKAVGFVGCVGLFGAKGSDEVQLAGQSATSFRCSISGQYFARS